MFGGLQTNTCCVSIVSVLGGQMICPLCGDEVTSWRIRCQSTLQVGVWRALIKIQALSQAYSVGRIEAGGGWSFPKPISRYHT